MHSKNTNLADFISITEHVEVFLMARISLQNYQIMIGI